MRIHSFQHVPFEDTGSIATELTRLGHQQSVTHWYRGEMPPSLNEIDLLIVMGGPMGAKDEAIYPWLAQEKQFISQAFQEGKKILGICLGAQLIASVLGAEVKRNKYREIGWFPLKISESSLTHPIAQSLARTSQVFHWHGDTFDLPAKAQLIASSEACAHQAFVIKHQVFAFQFHLETTAISAAALIEHCRGDLDDSKYVQKEQEILNNSNAFQAINSVMNEIIEFILSD